MRLSDFKQAWSLFQLHELSPRKPDTDMAFSGNHIGVVRYQDYKLQGFPVKEIPLLTMNSRSYSPVIAGIFKNGKIFIAVKQSFLEIYQDDYIRACFAHEVGHIVSGHFEGSYKGRGMLAFSDKALDAFDRYKMHPTQKNLNKANIETMKALFRKGMSMPEIEADLAASKYVPKQDLIYLHSDSLRQNNPFASLEKRNRIEYIARSFPEGSQRKEGFFKLEIEYITGAVI